MGFFHILFSKIYLNFFIYCGSIPGRKCRQIAFRHVQSKFCVHQTAYPWVSEDTFLLDKMAGEWNSIVHIVHGIYCPYYHGWGTKNKLWYLLRKYCHVTFTSKQIYVQYKIHPIKYYPCINIMHCWNSTILLALRCLREETNRIELSKLKSKLNDGSKACSEPWWLLDGESVVLFGCRRCVVGDCRGLYFTCSH
jgi:hypothetical protein